VVDTLYLHINTQGVVRGCRAETVNYQEPREDLEDLFSGESQETDTGTPQPKGQRSVSQSAEGHAWW
jgi:hypothetical protein